VIKQYRIDPYSWPAFLVTQMLTCDLFVVAYLVVVVVLTGRSIAVWVRWPY